MAGVCLSGYGLVESDAESLLTGIWENQRLVTPSHPGGTAGSVLRIVGECQGNLLNIHF
jgi:hypothetical protein